MSTDTKAPVISQLSKDELLAEIKRREQAEKAAAEAEKKQYAKDNDDFVNNTVGDFLRYQPALKELKESTIIAANDLYDRMYELQDKEPKEVKSFQRMNAAGDKKIVVERQERFEFTDEAQVHIEAIKDIFKTKFASRNKGLYDILDSLLIKNSKKEYDPKLLAKARREVRKLGDESLIKEFDKLDECQRVSGTSLYCRAYHKDAKGKWQEITLNFSSL